MHATAVRRTHLNITHVRTLPLLLRTLPLEDSVFAIIQWDTNYCVHIFPYRWASSEFMFYLPF